MKIVAKKKLRLWPLRRVEWMVAICIISLVFESSSSCRVPNHFHFKDNTTTAAALITVGRSWRKRTFVLIMEANSSSPHHRNTWFRCQFCCLFYYVSQKSFSGNKTPTQFNLVKTRVFQKVFNHLLWLFPLERNKQLSFFTLWHNIQMRRNNYATFEINRGKKSQQSYKMISYFSYYSKIVLTWF